jgi:hypothetical protein
MPSGNDPLVAKKAYYTFCLSAGILGAQYGVDRPATGFMVMCFTSKEKRSTLFCNARNAVEHPLRVVLKNSRAISGGAAPRLMSLHHTSGDVADSRACRR